MVMKSVSTAFCIAVKESTTPVNLCQFLFMIPELKLEKKGIGKKRGGGKKAHVKYSASIRARDFSMLLLPDSGACLPGMVLLNFQNF